MTNRTKLSLRLICCVCSFLLLFHARQATGQVLGLRYLVDSSLGYRDDTARLFRSWCAAGFCQPNWMYGNSSRYLALGNFDTGGNTISRFVGMFIQFGKDEWEFRNRRCFYRTPDEAEYLGWPAEAEKMGFRSVFRSSAGTGDETYYYKEGVFLTFWKGMRGYGIWERNSRKGIMIQRYDPGPEGKPAFVAFADIKPVLFVDELLRYFADPKDTASIKKTLFGRGFTESVTDKNYLNILSMGDRQSQYYSEVFMISLIKNRPEIVYRTEYEFLASAWEYWLKQYGFTEVEPAMKLNPTERHFLKGTIQAGFETIRQEGGEVQYQIYLKRRSP